MSPYGPWVPTGVGRVKGEMPKTWEGGMTYSEEPLQAFRAWRARPFDGDHYLLPLYCSYPPWRHCERFEALCPHVLKHHPPADKRITYGPSPNQFSSGDYKSLGAYLSHGRDTEHPPDEPTPYPGCSCGVYVTQRLEQIRIDNTVGIGIVAVEEERMKAESICVVGSVRIWGRITECERGWRAQYAYPERLFIVLLGMHADPRNEPSEDSRGWHQQQNFMKWQKLLSEKYMVPVGFCRGDNASLEALGRAIAD